MSTRPRHEARLAAGGGATATAGASVDGNDLEPACRREPAVAKRRPAMRALPAFLAFLAFLAAIAVAGCATFRAPPTAILKVECNVPDATVWLDDGLVGRASELAQGKAIGAGFRRFELRHPGHFTHYAELSLREGETAIVRATLRPLLE